MKSVSFFVLLVTISTPSLACLDGSQVGDRAYREAITAEIKKNKEWSTYSVERIGSTMNTWEVTLKKGKEVIELKFNAHPSADCKAEVELISSNKAK